MKPIYLPLILLLFLTVTTVFAQQRIETITKDNKPLTSELNIIRLEDIARVATKEATSGGKIIIVARLGDNENSRKLNQRRLHNVQTFLSKYKAIGVENIIVTEGEKTIGYGRVEVYVGGKRIETLTAPKNKDIEVDCCEGDTDYYPSKDLLQRFNGKRRQ